NNKIEGTAAGIGVSNSDVGYAFIAMNMISGAKKGGIRALMGDELPATTSPKAGRKHSATSALRPTFRFERRTCAVAQPARHAFLSWARRLSRPWASRRGQPQCLRPFCPPPWQVFAQANDARRDGRPLF